MRCIMYFVWRGHAFPELLGYPETIAILRAGTCANVAQVGTTVGGGVMTLIVRPVVLAKCLIVIITCLSTAHFASQYLNHVAGYTHQWGLERQFNLVNEANIPAWYSSVALLLSALLLSVVAARERRVAGGDARHWAGLALIFYYLSLDEAAQIHEMMKVFDGLHPTGLFFYSWILVGAAFVGLLGVLYLGFLTRLPAATRWVFVLAGSLYVAGALGVEMLESRYHYLNHTWTDLSYGLLVGVEETLEMSGIALFIYGISSHLARSGGMVRIRFIDDTHQAIPLSSASTNSSVRASDRSAA